MTEYRSSAPAAVSPLSYCFPDFDVYSVFLVDYENCCALDSCGKAVYCVLSGREAVIPMYQAPLKVMITHRIA